MAVWSSAYVTSLPNSSFAWIDGSGGRHLPYKDAGGKVDKAHTRNALARLNQVKGMPAGTAKAVRAKLERALNKANNMSEIFRYIDLRELDIPEDKPFTFQAWPYGSWEHPLWGEITMDEQVAASFIQNFKDNVLGVDPHIDYSHKRDPSKGDKAAGWIKDMSVDENGLNFTVDLTPQAKREIANKEWRYFSPTYRNEWENPVTGTVHDYVMMGGGLTNQPFLKGIAPLNFSEVADWERMEPGSGTPVPPEDEAPLAPTPREITDPKPNPNVKNNLDDKAGEKTVDEKALRELFGLDEKVDLTEYLKELKADNEALQSIKDEVDKVKNLATDYPDAAQELAEARQFRLETEAKQFGERYTKNENGKGFAPATIELVQDAYPKLSLDSRKTLAAIFDSILEKGFVDFKEHGTSQSDEFGGTSDDPAAKIASRINELMEKDELTFQAAYRQVALESPDEFQQYTAIRGSGAQQALARQGVSN